MILTPEKVFTTLSFCLMMRLTLFKFFVFSVQFVAEARIACKRIGDLLLLVVDSGEGAAAVFTEGAAAEARAEARAEEGGAAVDAPVFELRDASFSWLSDATVAHDSARAVLRGVTLSAQPGDLVCIVGPVGSGKTSLLMALAGEIDALRGGAETDGLEGNSGSSEKRAEGSAEGSGDASRRDASSSMVDIPSARAAGDARPAVR